MRPSTGSGQAGRLALVKLCLSRLATDGSSGGMELSGPRTWLDVRKGKPWDGNLHVDTRCCPYSAAFSPDGRRLYLAGYSNYSRLGGRGQKTWLGGVACVDYEGDAPARVFTGALDMNSGLTPVGGWLESDSAAGIDHPVGATRRVAPTWVDRARPGVLSGSARS